MMSVTALLGGDAKTAETQIDCAIDLTRHLRTVLTGMVLMPDPATAMIHMVGPEAIYAGSAACQAVREAQDNMRKDMQALFDRKTEEAGGWLQSSFVSETGSVQGFACGAATLADAFVFPHGSADSAHALNPAFEHVLMEARLPLVLAPQIYTPDQACMIAWDGSPQAARAVRLHLPLIAAFGKVIIAQHPEKLSLQTSCSPDASAAALADWLEEERIETNRVELDGSVADSLMDAVETHKIGLLIMGAYGHNRIGEFLFGGTSRTLLNSDTAPTLALCH